MQRSIAVEPINGGGQTHRQQAAEVPVLHWIELFDPLRDNCKRPQQ